ITIADFDRTKGTILVKDESVFDVVPYSPGKPVEYKLRYDANPGTMIDDYQMRDIMFKVDGEDKLPTIQSGTTTDASVRIIPITLTGKSRYNIQRVSEHRQVLDSDPVILIAPDYVCAGMQIQIRCKHPALSIGFAEIGIDGAFKPQFDHVGRDP